MAIVLNGSNKGFKLVFQGQQFTIPIGEIVEIPEEVASLYFAYGIDNLTVNIIDWCCERFKYANPEFSQLSSKNIWNEILSKVKFGKDAVDAVKKSK